MLTDLLWGGRAQIQTHTRTPTHTVAGKLNAQTKGGQERQMLKSNVGLAFVHAVWWWPVAPGWLFCRRSLQINWAKKPCKIDKCNQTSSARDEHLAWWRLTLREGHLSAFAYGANKDQGVHCPNDMRLRFQMERIRRKQERTDKDHKMDKDHEKKSRF